jgi:hypothetical protein
MSTTFNLTNTASDVNTAIQAVVGADTTPTDGSSNMVTSSGVKLALNGLATAGTLTTASFTQATLEDSNDGLTLSDSAIPTSKAVLESAKKLSAWINVQSSTATMPSGGFSGTAANDMLLMADQPDSSNEYGRAFYYQVPYAQGQTPFLIGGGDSGFIIIPIAKGEFWRIFFNKDISYCRLLYREFS